MARKSGDAPSSKNGLNDVIGIVLILFIALPLLCAQLSFDRNDISFITTIGSGLSARGWPTARSASSAARRISCRC